MTQEETTPGPRTGVSVIGTGAIGTAAARALLATGLPVRVWNRTRSAADTLLELGAEWVAGPVDAIGASGLTLVCVTDYAAVAEMLTGLGQTSLEPGRHDVAVLTTGTPDDAARLEGELGRRGIGFLDAGVQTAPDDIGTPRATLLYAGSRTVFDRHRSTLEALGTTTWLGHDPRAAATWDLALFGLWYDAQLGLLRAYDAVATAGGDVAAFAPAAARQLGHVVESTRATAIEVVDGDYARGPASIAEHLPVIRQLGRARARQVLGDGGLSAVERRLAALEAAGAGELGLSAVLSPALDSGHR